MIEVIPAVMPYSKEDVEDKISRVKDVSEWIQLDVMDGNFVQSISWPYKEGDINDFSQYSDLNISLDLMTNNPEIESLKWVGVGVKRIIIHVESITDKSFLQELRNEEVEITLSLSPSTPNSVLDEYEGMYDSVQFMGIEKIGYQGQKFQEIVPDKIKEFKKIHPETKVGVDGGVNFETAPLLVESGVDRLISGSALFDSENISETYKKFQDLVN
jgi:ribulose-phosphate 3-epimerase